jgi:glycosyltransferase involved in cell wall biosynthesis
MLGRLLFAPALADEMPSLPAEFRLQPDAHRTSLSAASDLRLFERHPPGPPLHVLQVFEPRTGGVPTYATILTEGLIARGWRVSVACPASAKACERLRAAGVDLVPIEVQRFPRPWEDSRAVRRIARWCHDRGVTLIHGHSSKAGLLCALAGRRARVPSVYTPHGWAFQMRVTPPLRAAYALAERQFAHRYHAAVVSVSASGRTTAERWRVAPRGRIEVIRTGLPDRVAPATRVRARHELGVRDDVVLAAWVGRIGAPKRPRDLAPIARRLAGTVQIVALCEGLHGTSLAADLRSAGVLLVDPRVEPATVYAAADMVLHTSDWEGCPLVVLEAMSAKLPVVAYGVGGIPEQIRVGRTGYVVARGDVDTMAQCALALARNEVVRARMGEAGYQRAAQVFSYDSMLDRTVDMYLAVAGPDGVDPRLRDASEIQPPVPAAESQVAISTRQATAGR